MRLSRGIRLVSAAALGTVGLSATGVAVSGVLAPTVAGAVGCTAAGTTGLNAALVATTSGQTINAASLGSSTLTATGCDYGIYVGPGITGVTITGITVTGANDTGIFAEQTSGLGVNNTTVTGNGVNPNTKLASYGGIVLAGVSTSTVQGDTVTNNGGGGIFVNDNGPVDPGALNAGPTATVNSLANLVTGNTINGNYGSCAIVEATHNAGTMINGGGVENNTITGHVGVFKSTGPDLGGIVFGTASASATVSNVQVSGNNVSGSYEGGIILHAHAPNDVISGMTITSNIIGPNNNWGQTNGPPTTAGIIISAGNLPAAVAAKITTTTVTGNTIAGQYYGIWQSNVSGPGVITTPNSTTVLTGGSAVYTTPTPGSGYWQVASDGGIFNYGNAGFYGSSGALKLNKPIVGMTSTQDQGGYWLVASDGGIFSYGDATFWGSAGNLKLVKPVVGMAATPYVPGAGGTPASPAGLGYWLVASDGGIFTYGDATFYGSAGALKLNQPVVGMTATPDGKGYWLVASDGGIFNYGDAGFYGSTGNIKLNKPIVGIASTPDGKGYWLVASDGGVFAFGDAVFYGSAGNLKLNQPVVGISASPDGKGYWIDAADGGIFNYGDAAFFGSAGNLKLNQPVVGIASVGTTFSG